MDFQAEGTAASSIFEAWQEVQDESETFVLTEHSLFQLSFWWVVVIREILSYRLLNS